LVVGIAIILLLGEGTSINSSMVGSIPFENITVQSGGSSYATINTSNAQTAIVSVIATSAINMYLFNASNFNLWQSHVLGNASANGLKYAQAIYSGNSPFIFASTDLIMPVNVSLMLPKNELYNNSVYVVLDNTNGSASSSKEVTARVVYLVLNPSTTAKYRAIASRQFYLGAAAVLMLIVGVAVAIYGVVKKEKSGPGIQVPTGKNATSKEYIDSLYKNVNKRKVTEKKSKEKSSK
jgi:hypothetical protein